MPEREEAPGPLTGEGRKYILWLYFNAMVTKVKKWGNSLGLRLPKSAALEAQVSDGSEVEVRVSDGEIVIRPLRKTRFSLRRLLAAVRPANLHSEIDFGKPKGRELL